VTGTWEIYPEAGFKSSLLRVLRTSAVESYFSNDMSSLVLDIHITTEHADDAPRLSNLGALSIATLGIIPLNFVSNWDIDCDVSISKTDGTPIADYVFHETGVYDIWAFPWTPLTLLGAGIRGNHDGGKVAHNVFMTLVKKIIDTIEQNYTELSKHAGKQTVSTEETKVTFELPSATLVT